MSLSDCGPITTTETYCYSTHTVYNTYCLLRWYIVHISTLYCPRQSILVEIDQIVRLGGCLNAGHRALTAWQVAHNINH